MLEVKNLSVSFFTQLGEVKAVREINFYVGFGETIGIVGESGSGKSVTSLSIMNLLPFPGKVVGGSVLFEELELVDAPEKKLRQIRGKDIGMIFQDPMTSLNPVYTVGNQIMEPLCRHQRLNRKEARQKAVELLSLVGIPSPEKRFGQYPHEFSGGMRQRVMIAMALSCRPKLLIADEPTSALDVTIQAQIIELMQDLKKRLNSSIILITHDLGVIAQLCSRTAVMYAGIIVEQGTTREVFHNSKHPYTRGLLKSVPNINAQHKKRLVPIDGRPPDLLNPPAGCPFCPRCAYAMQICAESQPPCTWLDARHAAACWLLHPGAPQAERGR